MLFPIWSDGKIVMTHRSVVFTMCDDLRAVATGYHYTPKGLRQVMKRDFFILHYVTKGKGSFCGKPFKAGDGYVVVPNEAEDIVADKQDPYEVNWIMFKGTKAFDFLKECNLPCHNDVFTFDKTAECADAIKRTLFGFEPTNEREESSVINATLHQIAGIHFSTLSSSSPANTLSQQVMKYMNEKYYENITIESIANLLNYSRNYIYTQFKKEYGLSPQEYLLNLRIEKAKLLLLKERGLAIKDIAFSVGYTDPLYFSRLFRQKTGVSPKEFVRING